MNNSEKLLDDRENRVSFQNRLQSEYNNTLIVVKANYPTNNKVNNFTNYLVTKMFFLIKKECDILYYDASLSNEGLIYYLITKKDFKSVKFKMIELENSKLSRLVDIDVYYKYQSISRSDLNISPRKCYLCDLDAKVCSRNQNHSYQEVINYFNEIVIEDIFNSDVYSNLCIYGLINELAKPYGFGSVSFFNQGSHSDMNYKTFVNSIESISHNFLDFTNVDHASFDSLRSFGQKMEKDMFEITNNINTHKGSVFSLILILAGISLSESYDLINSRIKELSKDIYQDFNKLENSTSGIKIYQDYNISGIRKQAYEGYQSVFEIFVPYYEKSNDITKTYLKIINYLDDTTIIKRSSIQELEEIKKISLNIIDNENEYQAFDKYLQNKNISCGGSADLLSIVLILSLIKEYYYK